MLKLRGYYLAIFIFIICFASRLMFLSNYLEDWDSVQFALGLHQYSLVNHQPHPPGYPLYILIGRLFLYFFHDDNTALTMMSALFGSLCIFPLYLLTLKISNKLVAIISCIIFLLTPVEWTLSEVALSNIPGLFFLLSWIYLLLKGEKNKKQLIINSLIAGLILGVRFTEFPIILTLLLLYSFLKFKIKGVILATFYLVLGMSIWMIPLILFTGWNSFLKAYFWIAGYILSHDSTFKSLHSLIPFIKSRIFNLKYLIYVGYTKFFIISFVVSLLLIIKRKSLRKPILLFLIVWLMSYLLPLAFIYNLEVPRYTLPILPPLAIITAIALTRLNKFLLFIWVILFLILTGKTAYSQVSRFKFTVPPNITSVKFVKSNFDPAETTLATTFTYRQFQYYAHEFSSFYLQDIISSNINRKTIITDYVGTKPPKNYILKETKEFTGDRDIYTRISSVKLYIYAKTSP